MSVNKKVFAPRTVAPNAVLAVAAVVAPVPPLAIGRVPETCEERETPDNVPPSVRLPEEVTVPVKVIPFTVPVPPTEVTVPPVPILA